MSRPPIKQTVIALVGVAVLCSLGTWQMQRLHWKNGIVTQLENEYRALENNRAGNLSTATLQKLSQEKHPLAIGKVHGALKREGAILLGPKSEEGRVGYHLLVPMELADGRTLIVNTGWVDAIWKDSLEDRLVLLPDENIAVTGILRKPDWNSFTSKNSPANDLWFRADIDEIANAKNIASPYPFVLYRSASEPSLHDIRPIDEHWLPRNKHLQYALFWYAMAATLLIVYGFYWRARKHNAAN